jgi:hypothetical protein
VADYWGVLSAPTTFIIDARGQPRAVNHGLASMEKLLRQLEASEGAAGGQQAAVGKRQVTETKDERRTTKAWSVTDD